MASRFGISKQDGSLMSGDDHLVQSVQDIISTVKGSLLMNREFGSEVHLLQDAPVDQEWYADMASAIADAVNRWEPRVTVKKVYPLNVPVGGDPDMGVVIERVDTGELITIGDKQQS